jgi:tRNA(Ile)-lysidine synthase
VAVSGGADSVALLHALHALARRRRWRLMVAHLNHGIRGRAAAADAAFVRDLSRQLRLPCTMGRAAVPALARQRGVSLEMAARAARYAFFARAARRAGAAVVATAHTADDQAETVLMRLLRGAGPAGLGGIPYAAEHPGIRVVRPLLDVTRPALLAYLQSRKFGWREDETNADESIPRNRVRHDLLPRLERDFNPQVREALLRGSRLIRDDGAFLDHVAAGLHRAFGKGHAPHELDLEQVRACVPALRRRILRLWLQQAGMAAAGLDFDVIERISALAGRVRGGATLTLSGGWRVTRGSNVVRVSRPTPPPAARATRYRLRVPGLTPLPALGVRIHVKVAPGLVRERDARPGKWPARASLSLAAWRQRALYVRTARPGDRMQPYGLTGSKKLQDILVDAKVPRAERALLPVVECGHRIIWLPGYRIDRAWAVADPGAPALQITVEPIRAGTRSAPASTGVPRPGRSRIASSR